MKKMKKRKHGKTLNHRILNIFYDFDEKLVDEVANFIHQVIKDEFKGPILVLIHSPGGETDAASAIYGMLTALDNRIITCATGICASAGTVIHLCANKNDRYVLKDTKYLVHSRFKHS